MRTTLSIDDELLDKAKRQALDMGVTVSELVNRVLRRGLAAEPVSAQHYTTITFGEPQSVAVDWAGADDQLEHEHDEWLLRKASL